MIPNTARRYAVATFRFIVRTIALLLITAAVLAGLYFISDPFYSLSEWANKNHVIPLALVLILAPIIATVAGQMNENITQQVKQREPKSIRRAYLQLEGQTEELVMRWLTWLSFTAGAVALVEIVDRI